MVMNENYYHKKHFNSFKWYILEFILIILGGLLGVGLCLLCLCLDIDQSFLGGILLYIISIPSTYFLHLWHDVWHFPPYGDQGFVMIIIVPSIQFFLMGALLTWWICHRLKKRFRNQRQHLEEEKGERPEVG